MPSGSHGGSRGGHSFGGSRAGRSSGFKFTSTNRNNTYYQRNRYSIYGRSYYGRPTRYYSNSRIGSLISFLVFALICMWSCSFSYSKSTSRNQNSKISI